jgi:hypothetical protein
VLGIAAAGGTAVTALVLNVRATCLIGGAVLEYVANLLENLTWLPRRTVVC